MDENLKKVSVNIITEPIEQGGICRYIVTIVLRSYIVKSALQLGWVVIQSDGSLS